jgi:hypothetical protein
MRDRAKLAVQAWEALREHVSKLAEKVNVWKGSPITLADAGMLADRLLGIEGKKEEGVEETNHDGPKDLFGYAATLPEPPFDLACPPRLRGKGSYTSTFRLSVAEEGRNEQPIQSSVAAEAVAAFLRETRVALGG